MDVRTGAKKALAQLLEPLAGFVFDSGLSIREFHAILRTAAVRSVAARQLQIARRVNISGISASTGISRAEISRILRAKSKPPRKSADKPQQSTSKILSVWQRDPKYTTPHGHPADLKIYGRGASFDSLVRRHGKGIPTRAMLDELIRNQAVELRPAQTIRLKAGVAVDRGLMPQTVKAFGDRVSELMSTMLQNMRDPENAAFVANVSDVKASAIELPLLRREIASRGAEFLNEIEDMLDRSPADKRKADSKKPSSLSITVCYHEGRGKTALKKSTLAPRRNFRRSAQ